MQPDLSLFLRRVPAWGLAAARNSSQVSGIVSVQMATAAAPTHWQPIGEIVAEFRTECSDFEHLVQSLFDQLDQLRAELERKARDLEKERQRVAERERQLSEQRKETSRIAHQFEHQEAKLSEALTELDELKNLIRRQGEESSQREALFDTHLHKQLETLQRERQTLHRQLTDSQNEMTKNVGLSRDLAQARKEIADLCTELAARGEGNYSRSSGGEDQAVLEAELEMVRSRAAELSDALAQERRTAAELKQESSTELRQLRRIVERQADLLSERSSGNTVNVARETTVEPISDDDEPIEETASADPVISSVMAQFAKLQKDVSDRRKARKVK